MSQASQKSATRGILKKVTLKTINAQPDVEKLINWKNEHGEKVPMPLARFIGIASAYEPVTNDNGVSIKLTGQFKAINLETGETFVGANCYLPGTAADLIYGALRALGDAGGQVEFAFEVGAHYDADAVTKYVYDVQQIMAPGEANPLDALEKKFLLPALEAPRTETQESGDGDSGKGSKGGKGKK